NRFTVSPRNNPKPNADGSLTLYFQNESPGKELENNWLPAPKGEFIAMLRMYWPKDKAPSVLNGTWTPPAVVRREGLAEVSTVQAAYNVRRSAGPSAAFPLPPFGPLPRQTGEAGWGKAIRALNPGSDHAGLPKHLIRARQAEDVLGDEVQDHVGRD